MRQPSIIILLISFILSSGILLPAFSAVKGRLEYSIPLDYSNLSEEDLNFRARDFFNNAVSLNDNVIDTNTTNALMLYAVLQKINPECTEYYVRQGILYDKIGKDRHARGNFARAIQINHVNPKPYFYYAEFYYKRQSYCLALKYYKDAYRLGYNSDYKTLYKMADVYDKFGDTRSALKYLKEAELLSSSSVISDKIKLISQKDTINKEFYSDTRIRKEN